MKKNFSDYVVATIVVVCSIVLLAALTLALSGYQLKKPSRVLQIDYHDVKGIHLASELRYAGAPAGRVLTIRHLTARERTASVDKLNAVRVTVTVNEDVPPLPADVAATIDSDTLLSDKFIALSAGTVGGPLLANNAVIQGQPGSLDELLNGAGPLVQKAGDLLSGLQGDLKDLMPKVGTAVEAARGAVTSLQTLLRNANSLVDEKGSLRQTLDQLHNAVGKLEGVESDLDDVLKKTGGLVGSTNQNVDARMKELGVVMQNLKVVTTYLKEFSKQIAEKPNRVIFAGKPVQLTPEDTILKSTKPLPARSQAGAER